MNINYPYLPDGREIIQVGLENRYMSLAKVVCDSKSTDIAHPTGAVVVKDGEVIGEWANQSVLRNKKMLELHKSFCIRRLLKIKTGTRYWLCPGCASHKYHAESGAVSDALRKGFDTKGADLYLYGHWWCCKPCWDTMIKNGIKNVFVLKDSETLFK